MKRNNIIYIFILSILMLSIRNTYAATSIVSFKNSSGGHIVSMTMTYQLDKKNILRERLLILFSRLVSVILHVQMGLL